MTIIEDKKEYRKQLDIIKDENNGESVRREAFCSLSSVFMKIQLEEPNCKLDSPKEIKIKFIDKLNVPDVVWFDNIKTTEREEKEIEKLEKIRQLAYKWTRLNHPKLDDQGDKFGQIVNSRMHLIIASRQ